MARTIIFGDVHGCIDELVQLWRTLDVQPDDDVVSVGDLVHKGPADGEVVRWCRTHGVRLTLGNHELQQAAFRRALAAVPMPADLRDADPSVRMAHAAGQVRLKNAEARAQRLRTEAELTDADRAYLEDGLLSQPVPGGAVVHAGVLPSTTHLPGAVQHEASARVRQQDALVTRVRYVTSRPRTHWKLRASAPGEVDAEGLTREAWLAMLDEVAVVSSRVTPAGAFVVLGEERPGDVFWAEVYDGRFGHLVFGHDAVRRPSPRRFPYATGLDTGCVMGGHLTARVIGEGQGWRDVSVPARRAYIEDRRART